jgi:hypothetical protein
MFKGIPVREARASIHVQPNQKDIDGATQESPVNCAYARCIRRVLDAPSVFVFKTIAYIQTLDEAGQPLMERYTVKKYAREYLMRFDHGEKVPPGGFVFHRPNRSVTLTYKQKQGAIARQEGRYSPRVSTGPKVKQRQFSMRNGKGCVHLFGTEDQIKIWAT